MVNKLIRVLSWPPAVGSRLLPLVAEARADGGRLRVDTLTMRVPQTASTGPCTSPRLVAHDTGFKFEFESLEMSVPLLRQQPYAHRAFMGLTGSFLRDPQQRALLQRLMPELHSQCVQVARTAEQPLRRLMRLLEGNPLLAAYGLQRGKCGSMPLEWDIWLDPAAPHDLNRARIVHGNACATAMAEGEPLHAAQASDVMTGHATGTDVHLGMHPAAWLRVFNDARGVQGAAPCTVFLDVKSSWSSAADIAAFAQSLQQVGVGVDGVLSFKFAQLGGDLQGLRPVHLVHGPGGLAAAQRLGHIPSGGHAMFNAGALIVEDADGVRTNPQALALTQAAQRRGNLQLALYLQEDDISPAALRVLIDCIHANPETFTHGLAYGGLSGVAEGTIAQGVGLGGQGAHILREDALWQAL